MTFREFLFGGNMTYILEDDTEYQKDYEDNYKYVKKVLSLKDEDKIRRELERKTKELLDKKVELIPYEEINKYFLDRDKQWEMEEENLRRLRNNFDAMIDAVEIYCLLLIKTGKVSGTSKNFDYENDKNWESDPLFGVLLDVYSWDEAKHIRLSPMWDGADSRTLRIFVMGSLLEYFIDFKHDKSFSDDISGKSSKEELFESLLKV